MPAMATFCRCRALDCGSGATLAKEQADIGKRNEVVHELGVTAARLRAKLGEPADSLARFNQPLEKALSSSLEALQAGSQGRSLYLAGDVEGALKTLSASCRDGSKPCRSV